MSKVGIFLIFVVMVSRGAEGVHSCCKGWVALTEATGFIGGARVSGDELETFNDTCTLGYRNVG